MARKKELKELNKDDRLMSDFDYMDMDDGPYGDEVMAGVMSELIGASNHQMQIAIELTRIVVEGNSTKDVNEEQVFSIFKKASKVVSENNILKTMLKQLGMD